MMWRRLASAVAVWQRDRPRWYRIYTSWWTIAALGALLIVTGWASGLYG